MDKLFLLLIFCFGAAIGSFLNVLILRLPKGQSLTGRSRCAACGRILDAADLVPIFSYLFLGGRCRRCRVKISPRYLIIELTTGLLFVLAWQFIKPTDAVSLIQLFQWWLIMAVLLAVFVIDLEHYLILDQIIFPASIVMATTNLALDLMARQPLLNSHSHFVSGLIAAAALVFSFLCLWYFSQGRWMGFGDVKLMLFLGLALGWPLAGVGLMLAVQLGGAVSLGLLAFSKKTLKSPLPFGTFLSLGALTTLFYGEKLLAWYLALLGF